LVKLIIKYYEISENLSKVLAQNPYNFFLDIFLTVKEKEIKVKDFIFISKIINYARISNIILYKIRNLHN
jgi:hypothetical protein